MFKMNMLFLSFLLVVSSDEESEERRKGKVISLVVLTACLCLIFVSFLLCIARVTKEMNMQFNYRRGLHRQFKALQSYKETTCLTVN